MLTRSPFRKFVREWWVDLVLLVVSATAFALSMLAHASKEATADPVLALRLAGLACIAAWLLLRIPRWQTRKLTAEHPPTRLTAENEARRTLATIVSGAAVFGTVYFASVQLAEQRDRAEKDRLLAERRLVTETYVKVFEMLATGPEENPTRNTGAIYALGELGKISASHRRPVMGLLQAYVRQRYRVAEQAPPRQEAPQDLQAAINVMGRWDVDDADAQPVAFDFSLLDLSRLRFDGLNFAYANFAGSDLTRASMAGTKLCGANFRDASLNGVEFVGADLRLAYVETPEYVRNTDLRGALVVWPDRVRYIDGTFEAAGILRTDAMRADDSRKVKDGRGHFVDDAAGTSEWRTHMRRLLGMGGTFTDGCGRLPTRVWGIVEDPAPTVFSK